MYETKRCAVFLSVSTWKQIKITQRPNPNQVLNYALLVYNTQDTKSLFKTLFIYQKAVFIDNIIVIGENTLFHVLKP